jgi:hypothetical protein
MKISNFYEFQSNLKQYDRYSVNVMQFCIYYQFFHILSLISSHSDYNLYEMKVTADSLESLLDEFYPHDL